MYLNTCLCTYVNTCLRVSPCICVYMLVCSVLYFPALYPKPSFLEDLIDLISGNPEMMKLVNIDATHLVFASVVRQGHVQTKR